MYWQLLIAPAIVAGFVGIAYLFGKCIATLDEDEMRIDETNDAD